MTPPRKTNQPVSELEAAKRKWQADVQNRTAETVGAVLSAGRSVASFDRVAGQLLHHIDRVISERHAEAERVRQSGRELPQVACCKGCSSCCHTMRLLANGLEVVRLTQYLQATRTPAEIEILLAQLKAYDSEVVIRPDGTPAPQRIGCVFLEDDACSVYPARPAACRSFHSLDLSKCLARFADPRKGDVPQIVDVHDAVAPINAGIMQALAKYRLRESPLLLWKAMIITIEDPSACERYLQGEDVFATATTPAIEKAAKAGGLRAI
jgi:uncharacterized protein